MVRKNLARAPLRLLTSLTLVGWLFTPLFAQGVDPDEDYRPEEEAVEVLGEKGRIEGFSIHLLAGFAPNLLGVNPYGQEGLLEQPPGYGLPLEVALKQKFWFLYLRTGVGYAAQMNSPGTKGKKSSSLPVKTNASFLRLPMMLGFNFFIRNQGSLQLGLGPVYLRGSVDYTYKNTSNNTGFTGTAFGWMYQLAMEQNINGGLVLDLEFNWYSGRTSGLVANGSDSKFAGKEIIFDGKEFLLGVGYYF